MNYGKNQQALLKFLEKYPNQWHRIKRRKAIDAAKRLARKFTVYTVFLTNSRRFYVNLQMPQMLIKQN